jgi:hypothetical protein
MGYSKVYPKVHMKGGEKAGQRASQMSMARTSWSAQKTSCLLFSCSCLLSCSCLFSFSSLAFPLVGTVDGILEGVSEGTYEGRIEGWSEGITDVDGAWESVGAELGAIEVEGADELVGAEDLLPPSFLFMPFFMFIPFSLFPFSLFPFSSLAFPLVGTVDGILEGVSEGKSDGIDETECLYEALDFELPFAPVPPLLLPNVRPEKAPKTLEKRSESKMMVGTVVVFMIEKGA